MEVVEVTVGQDEYVSIYRFRYGEDESSTTCALPSIFTVTQSDHLARKRHHEELDQSFRELLGHPAVSLCLTKQNSSGDVPTGPLESVETLLRSKLFAAFQSQNATTIECLVNCAYVTIGGFGAQWHQDAASHLTFDNGSVADYLAVYYLEPFDYQGNPWLECALVEDNAQVSMKNFLPVSTEHHGLLVFRNDQILHRTPLLSNLLRGDVRRFFYMPFRILDASEQPVMLQPPQEAQWKNNVDGNINKRIESELQKHDLGISLEDYISGKCIQESSRESFRAERPNWLFQDLDDY